MTQDPLVQRIKEAILRLTYPPERVTEPADDTVVDARDSVRRLARRRVADLLRQLRAVHGYSYEQVQEQTGLSQQLLFDVEYRERRLSLDELRLLARCYQVSPGDILGIELD